VLPQFEKWSLDGIEYVNNVPKVVFVCWFGVYGNNMPVMTARRFNAFQSLVTSVKVPVIVLTDSNFSAFEKPGFPIHSAFNCLSGNHKSDYARAYMLLHYGGGYHDIKFRVESWENCWEQDNWTQDSSVWLFGRREKSKECIGFLPGTSDDDNNTGNANNARNAIQNEYLKLVTMCWIICKPDTPYLRELMNQIHTVLDTHKSALLANPSASASGYRIMQQDTNCTIHYPLRWLQLMGEIFHPLLLAYTDHIKFGLPDALKKLYK
jgi:mannosyltransferase OCH1-like enzyme